MWGRKWIHVNVYLWLVVYGFMGVMCLVGFEYLVSVGDVYWIDKAMYEVIRDKRERS